MDIQTYYPNGARGKLVSGCILCSRPTSKEARAKGLRCVDMVPEDGPNLTALVMQESGG